MIAANHISESPDCIGDGLQANYTSGCQQYYRCSGGNVKTSYNCPPGTAFQPAVRECVPQTDVPCVRHLCAPRDTAQYAAPGTQCQFYYKCEGGVAADFVCPSGTWFDTKKQDCTPAAGVCYEPVCTGQRDGRHPDSTQSCRRSLLCSGGSLAAVDSSGDVPARCPSPRSTSVAFPITGKDRCAHLPDGRHPASAVRCRDYVLCKDGETKASVRCPEAFHFDGEKCSPAATTPCVDGCSHRDNGFHVDLASGCREYFYCVNQSSLLVAMCPEGSLFDGQSCVPSTSYKCPVSAEKNPCSKREDGFYRDYKDCSSYIYCSSERVMLRESCGDDEVWNGKLCVKSGEFRCEGPEPWSGCAEKASGYYQDRNRDSDCKNYYHCKRGMKMSFSCSPGLIFDGEQCVRSETYTCPSLEKDSCDFKSDGYYPQTSGGCRAYYMCTNGYKVIYLCDESQMFNGEKCVSADDYKCPFQSEDCKGKSNGYHQDIQSNCRKYFFCENGEKLTTIQCSGSKIYNGQSCVNTKEYQCPVGQGNNPCLYNPDGHYVQSGTKCRKYFKCTDYKVIEHYTCPSGQVFDGLDSCAVRNCSSQAITCERDGFFLDLPSRCKAYHICTDKRKSTLQCEGNKVFNGQLCVPADTFPCPDECSQNHCNNTV